MVADIVPEALRGTAYGTYNAVLGILDFPASLVAGLLWRWITPSAPFIFGGAMALIAALLMAVTMKDKSANTKEASPKLSTNIEYYTQQENQK